MKKDNKPKEIDTVFLVWSAGTKRGKVLEKILSKRHHALNYTEFRDKLAEPGEILEIQEVHVDTEYKMKE